MHFTTLDDLLDILVDNPDELFVMSNSKRCALYSSVSGDFLYLDGNFSGTVEECEAELRTALGEDYHRQRGQR